MAIVILVILSSFTSSIHSVAAQKSITSITFNDPKTGISFQYPSDWHTASQEYLNMMFGDDLEADSNSSGIQDKESNVDPIVMILPESLSGSAFFILSEILPFNLPIDRYFELTKENILLDPASLQQVCSNLYLQIFLQSLFLSLPCTESSHRQLRNRLCRDSCKDYEPFLSS